MEKFVDPVVEEVRERGQAFTARHDNDPKRIMDVLREYSKAHGERVVDQIRIVRSSKETA